MTNINESTSSADGSAWNTWKEIRIFTTTVGTDIVGGYLISQGIRGFVIEDAADFNEFLNATSPNWDYVEESLVTDRCSKESNLTLYLPDTMQGIEQFRQIEAGLPHLREANEGLDLGRLEIETASVNEEDWATAWKKYYHPVEIGKSLVIVPCWELDSFMKDSKKEGQTVITLDPGMAFGTGTHETTRLCLALLEECVTPDSTLLDIGTGSGILAVAALLLGAKSAAGVDIDEIAVKVAGENAELNGVRNRLDLYCGDLTEQIDGKFDVVCANIVADVIIRLSLDVTAFMKPDGVLLVSGIIEERKDEVTDALAKAGLLVCDEKSENGWVAIKLSL